MQDYEDTTLREECDYALCNNCHSLIKPYHNTSIMTITEKMDSSQHIKISKQMLASTHPFTRRLLTYHHLHCAKCGLYLEIHPDLDDDHSQKIFVCSHAAPHPYGLCYHCGLLYGINPMQKSIDIITILHSQIDSIEQDQNAKDMPPKPLTLNPLKIASMETSTRCAHKQGEDDEDEPQEKEEEEEEHSTEIVEVNDMSDTVESSDGDDTLDAAGATQSNGSRAAGIDESYTNMLALRDRLSNIHNSNKTASCPSSPHAGNHSSSSLHRKGVNAHSSIFSTLPHSLRGSPLLGPSTPSPRVLSRDVDETDKKWHEYLHRKEEKKATIRQRSNSKSKLQETQNQIEQLQLLLKQASSNKSNSKEFADIFRRGAYSSKVTLNLTQCVNNTEK